MKLAAVLVTSALAATAIVVAQPALASTLPTAQKTFVGTSSIFDIDVTEVNSVKPGLHLDIDPQGPITTSATGSTDGSIAATGTAVVTSGTHRFSYTYSTTSTRKASIAVPVDSLKAGDPIDVSVTAQTAGSSDVATLSVSDFDFVHSGVISLAGDAGRFQVKCLSHAMTDGLVQPFVVRSYGDHIPSLSATATFYSKGKKLFTKSVTLKHSSAGIVIEGGEYVHRGNYPKVDTIFRFAWNGKIKGKWVPGAYRWVLKVTDKATGKVFSTKHVPVHIMKIGTTCAAYGVNY